ncbi:hypothetical protein, partial [Sphingobium limneticum]|uniref:hypothetical protein n=1 Tax=Sphingobium limneticum TaxID=1007511 RepID=UPI001B884660
VVIVARRLLLATANGSQNSPTGAATYRPSKLTPTGLRNRRATNGDVMPELYSKSLAKALQFATVEEHRAWCIDQEYGQ